MIKDVGMLFFAASGFLWNSSVPVRICAFCRNTVSDSKLVFIRRQKVGWHLRRQIREWAGLEIG